MKGWMVECGRGKFEMEAEVLWLVWGNAEPEGIDSNISSIVWVFKYHQAFLDQLGVLQYS